MVQSGFSKAQTGINLATKGLTMKSRLPLHIERQGLSRKKEPNRIYVQKPNNNIRDTQVPENGRTIFTLSHNSAMKIEDDKNTRKLICHHPMPKAHIMNHCINAYTISHILYVHAVCAPLCVCVFLTWGAYMSEQDDSGIKIEN